MRVLWFTNTSSCYSNGTANCYNGGGWISSLEREMWKRSDVDMAVCFYFSGIDRPKKEVQDKTTYYYLVRRGQYTDWGVSKPIVIEDDVFIGANCLILKGVTIGARSIVAAGSVVTRSVPADCIVGGNPARIIKRLR